MARTPITLITGSLGCGKTTLLRRILRSYTGLRLAVLMNEFGEIPIDSQVIRGENVEIVELAGGCVCCSLTGEFEAAVREIIAKADPGIIVVEATGLAEADALVYEVEDNLPEVRLDSVICIVDAYMSIRHPYVGYTARTQLSVADIVLINKIDLVTTDEVKEVEAQVREYNLDAVLFKTVGCDVDPQLLFGLDLEDRPLFTSTRGDSDFQSFVYSTDVLLDEERFNEFVAELPDAVYRAKGFIRFPGKSRLFNYVVGRGDLEEFPAERTQVVFIGRGLDELQESILEDLKGCEAGDAV